MNMPNFAAHLEPLSQGFLARDGQLFIDGAWRPARSGETFEVVDPSTGRVFARAAAGGKADIDLAVAAARRAFDDGPWSRMNGYERSLLMLRLADLIEKHADELAVLESLDVGKPVAFARFGDLGMAIESLRYNAGWATKIAGETLPSSAPDRIFGCSIREPVGVVGAIVPWNSPLAMACGKLGAALAAGCTVVLKPAEQTPLSTLRLGELIAEAGFPEGVVNIVTGFGAQAGQALVDHPDVDKIAFTGSTRVGKAILAAASGNLKRVTLELGGKSPVFIFPDADLEPAIATAAMGVFINSGQVCVAGSRLFVHEAVFDRVVEGVAAQAERMKLGPGMEPGVELGPVVSARQRESILGYIERGVAQGARVATGGGAPEGEGYFVQPTVLCDTTAEMEVARQEIFGPVVCVMRFGDEDLATLARRANDTDYGLAARIWTRDIGKAHGLARKIRAGTIWINQTGGMEFSMPFGGYKQSGWGRENGRAGVEAYTELKTMTIGF